MNKDTKVKYINHTTRCYQCRKMVTRVLVLKKTNAPLCSLECERDYWLDILY